MTEKIKQTLWYKEKMLGNQHFFVPQSFLKASFPLELLKYRIVWERDKEWQVIVNYGLCCNTYTLIAVIQMKFYCYDGKSTVSDNFPCKTKVFLYTLKNITYTII